MGRVFHFLFYVLLSLTLFSCGIQPKAEPRPKAYIISHPELPTDSSKAKI